MPSYLVQKVIHYSIIIEADTDEEAKEEADATPIYDWEESADDYHIEATLIEERTDATL